MTGHPLSVLRISHSDVVPEWRGRQRNADPRRVKYFTITAKRWTEGGGTVELQTAPEEEDDVIGVQTLGRHPILFIYSPLPLYRALRQEWDVIDIHEEPYSIAALEIQLLTILARSRAAIVLYSAQNILRRYPLAFEWIERWTLRRAAAVSVCNSGTIEVLASKGLPAEKTSVIGLGFDPQIFYPPQEPTPPPREVSATGSRGALSVGFAGRLLAGPKGIYVLMQAVASSTRWTLHIAGTGPDEYRLHELAARLGIEDRVVFHGFLPHEVLGAFYRSMDAVVVPSIDQPTWKEQFGRGAIEAMACGVPTIVSDTEALKEVVGNAAMLIRQSVPADLVRALDLLASKPELRRELGRLGVAHARSRYTWNAISDAYADHYETAIVRN